MADRRRELAENLAVVEDRIAAACRAAGRARSEITLIAVTKTFPASDIAHLAALGVSDVGENRDQDAATKAATCREMGLTDVRWHFVGQLQTNKARSVSTYAHVVHSVDRRRLVPALDRAGEASDRLLLCLVQVDLDEGAASASGRGGAHPAEVGALAGDIEAAERLQLGGVMAVAPRVGEPARAFARLAVIARDLRTSYPGASIISAGMSGDLEAAVCNGATHLRVGTALLGSRPRLR